jgi:hypothetical protein
MSHDPAVATAICQINLFNQEHSVTPVNWPESLMIEGNDVLEMESRLFSSGAREIILHRQGGFARFILAEDTAELRIQEAPGLQPVRTLRYTCEGWFAYPK